MLGKVCRFEHPPQSRGLSGKTAAALATTPPSRPLFRCGGVKQDEHAGQLGRGTRCRFAGRWPLRLHVERPTSCTAPLSSRQRATGGPQEPRCRAARGFHSCPCMQLAFMTGMGQHLHCHGDHAEHHTTRLLVSALAPLVWTLPGIAVARDAAPPVFCV